MPRLETVKNSNVFSWGEAYFELCSERPLGLMPSISRFLILPWVQVKHLASCLLGQVARRIDGDWYQSYGHGVDWLETFVDRDRFRGSCYRAANWQVLGLTTGRGKDDLTHRPNRSRKLVLGLPLHADFRRCLGVGT